MVKLVILDKYIVIILACWLNNLLRIQEPMIDQRPRDQSHETETRTSRDRDRDQNSGPDTTLVSRS